MMCKKGAGILKGRRRLTYQVTSDPLASESAAEAARKGSCATQVPETQMAAPPSPPKAEQLQLIRRTPAPQES